jgi:magnesium-transporting ATPase (P-type)
MLDTEEKLRVVDFGESYSIEEGENEIASSLQAHHHHHPRFCTNRVSTAKYNIFTFIPKFLFVMFSRAAYFYFLVQMLMSWWEVVSPFGGIGFTMALVFVLAVSGAKEAVEDMKRHQFDKVTNQSTAHVVKVNHEHHNQDPTESEEEDGHLHGLGRVDIRDEKWEDVKVGQIILVMDGEEVPADCICIHTALDNTCYVNTANLDGETNLKIKRAMRGMELSKAEAESDNKYGEGEIHGGGDNLDMSSLGHVMQSSTERAKTMRDRNQMKEHAYKLAHIQGQICCEQPSANLHNFKGYGSISSNPWVGGLASLHEGGTASASSSLPATSPQDTKYPLDMGEVLLRGTRLMNSGYAFGLVIYTGKETRIFMNNSQTPIKSGSMEYFLNIQIVVLAILQIVLCLLCAVGSYLWREKKGFDMPYLMLNEFVATNYSNPVAYIVVYTLTFWILYSAMVPISLFVTLELVRFWQCIAFINFDPDMRIDNQEDPEDKSLWPKARNSNVNDDLARISYVFSDKTGTLTSNEMQLRLISAGTTRLGRESHKFEEMPPGMPPAHVASEFDPQLSNCFNKLSGITQIVDSLQLGTTAAKSSSEMTNGQRDVLSMQVLKFFTCMTLCHSVVPELDNHRVVGYQGPSPDEVCIVNTMKQLGFVFKENKSNIMYIDILGKKCKFRVLNVLDFSSDRKRMSVIVQDQRKKIYLICKGADTVMLPRTMYGDKTNVSNREEVDKIIHDYSCQGLRCLMFGAKELAFEEWKLWNKGFRMAANKIANREEAMEASMEEIEKDLHFIGITAVEDKLQEEVPESIQILRDAGIKVWVITGDKQETAVNIGIACRLISDPEKLLVLNEDCKEKLQAKVKTQLRDVGERKKQKPGFSEELVIDGTTLSLILSDQSLSKDFASLGALCDCVLVCRASPSQKAAIVTLMKNYEKSKLIDSKPWGLKWTGWLQNLTDNKVLSIGDGANDVPMIQRADVGVGIVGKEGRQASNNSDFSIARFRFLVRLLLVHGQVTQYRNANLIKYSFYKNIAISVMFMYFQFDSGFSGQASIDSLTLNFYNTVFTAIPILIFSLMDQPVENLETLLKYPKVYNTSKSLNVFTFWKAQIKAFVDAAICYYIPYYAAFASGHTSLDGLFAVGRISYIALQGVVTLEVCTISRHYTTLFVAFVLYSWLIMFPFFYLFEASMQGFGVPDPAQSGISTLTFASPAAWLQIVCVVALSIGIRFTEKGLKVVFFPDDVMILSEKEVSRVKIERIRKSQESNSRFLSWSTASMSP